MARSSFPLWLFFNLQLCVQFTNVSTSSGHDQRWMLLSQNHRYVLPRVRYITEDNGVWKSRGLSGGQRMAGKRGIKVEITFAVFQQNFTLDLYQNRGLFTSQYLERHEHFNGSGNNARKLDHCFFHGRVRGRVRSSVSLSTCEGLEGLIYDGTTSYYIEPMDKAFHLFYKIKDLDSFEYDSPGQRMNQDRDIHTVTQERLVSKRSIGNVKTRRRIRNNVFTETKYVELLIINDHKQFEACGKNLTKTNLRAKQIANIVDAIFKPLNVRVALVAVETWNVLDKVKADANADTYLSNLVKYRKRGLRKYPSDVTKLLTGISLKDSVRGKAHVMTICTEQSAGVVQDYSRNAAFTASTFAHELGHVFGMYHDEDLPRCVCKSPDSRGCVMSEHVGREPATSFSNCSLKGLEETLSRGLGSCLLNVPRTLYGGPVCGDGIVGGDEECDCGTAQECTAKENACCDHVNCKLRAHAQCADGPCCERCRFKKSRTVCRETVNECDIPEFCTGSSGSCPEDVYIHDGYSCANNTAYCYSGECLTHDRQCQDLWGRDAVSGPDKCYNYHNTRGNKYGFCHKTKKGKHRPCKLKNAKCGKLWCLARNRWPVIGIQRDVMGSQWPFQSKTVTCKGTNLQMGMDVSEAAMTLDGTKCADGKVCLDRKCVPVKTLHGNVPLCHRNCSSNGICTNIGTCYCFKPWTGTSCGTKLSDIKPTTITSKPIKTMLQSTSAKTYLITTKPRTVATMEPITTASPTGLQVAESTQVYITVFASFFALVVVLVAGHCSYKRRYKHRQFVVQNKNMKQRVEPRFKVIVI